MLQALESSGRLLASLGIGVLGFNAIRYYGSYRKFPFSPNCKAAIFFGITNIVGQLVVYNAVSGEEKSGLSVATILFNCYSGFTAKRPRPPQVKTEKEVLRNATRLGMIVGLITMLACTLFQSHIHIFDSPDLAIGLGLGLASLAASFTTYTQCNSKNGV